MSERRKRTSRVHAAAALPPELGPATAAWFARAFAAPTEVQRRGWPPIARGEHALLLAPTGSGKTLAAFLAGIDRALRLPADAAPGVRVLYVSPLKALAYDVERNLRAPLAGIELEAERRGEKVHPTRVAIRTGDTPARERRALGKDPAEILVTTPESLYLLLGSQLRESLRTVETVIIDEIHALAPTKRGAHLALSLERLVELCGHEPQRIGLSATQRPLDEIARFLGGERPVTIVDAGDRPRLDLVIEVPVDDSEHPPTTRRGDERSPREERLGVWPAIHARLLQLVQSHQSTIVFANSRRLCERLAQRLNELHDESRGEGARDSIAEPLVRAHHGLIARPQRIEIEELLKAGRLRGIVATSSLELGIDMGAVDLVIQVESPGAVSRGLQRVGRAGHGVGRRSQARIFPKFRADLLETAVVARRMLDGEVEPIRVPKNALDVLAQQIVAICADGPVRLAELERVVHRAYGYQSLSREAFIALLDMLSGRYPSDEMADLRPRLIWDRTDDTVVARRDARLLAIVNGGTIPDRGLYAVHLGEGGPRVGELDEEMVHESRPGEVFLLGASSWRITQITRDRVIVQPAPGEPGKMPFWRGEGPGRPIELGRALGAFVRELGDKGESDGCRWLQRDYFLDERAAKNLWRYVHEQSEATGTLPTDRSITVERFRDELGDWRVCILSPFGARIHAPWALALEARLGRKAGVEVQALWSDDGVVLRFADADEPPDVAALFPEPEEVEELVLEELSRSALFASRFRENAARALLLPRRRPGKRTPLWSQRLKAQALQAAAMRHPSFPIVLETFRECAVDVFDLPSLRSLLGQIRSRDVRVAQVETASASPFARSLAFAYVAAYMYEGDAPLAERRAQALTLDRNLLRELLGQEELRDLLDPEVIAQLERELQSLDEERRVRSPDGMHDLLRRIGDLSAVEAAARATDEPAPWLEQLERDGRAARMRIGRPAEERWVAVEDVARYRDALGAVPPVGLARVHLEPSSEPLPSLLARYARSHGPFAKEEAARRFGLTVGQVEPALRQLVQSGRLLEGELRPGATGLQLCDAEVLRRLRRATLAGLRNQVAPVEAEVLARFLGRWHGLTAPRPGTERLREALDQLEGAALPFSELEQAILPARVADYHPRMLDQLGATGEIVWIGRGALGGSDGRVALYWRHRVAAFLDPADASSLPSPLHEALYQHLLTRGASFFGQLRAAAPEADERDLTAALWDLAWAGLITNDTFEPLRSLGRPARGPRRAGAPGGRWSAVAQLAAPVAPTEAVHARALALLERYGIVSREAVTSEGIAGGFAQLAPVYRAMEEAGKVRRGWFVDGMAAMQFAHLGAVDRLRAARGDESAGEPLLLSALDPANPYGALLPWPADDGEGEGASVRPRRAAGAKVVLVRGRPVFYLERGGRTLRYFPPPSPDDEAALLEPALAMLRRLAAARRYRELRIEQVNGEAALRSRHLRALEAAGFSVQPGGLLLAGS